MPLPRAILFDLDDTLIRAYAQPEEAWRRLLGSFAEPLDAPDAAAIERVRVVVMDEARTLWIDQTAAAKWRLDIPAARRLTTRRATLPSSCGCGCGSSLGGISPEFMRKRTSPHFCAFASSANSCGSVSSRNLPS